MNTQPARDCRHRRPVALLALAMMASAAIGQMAGGGWRSDMSATSATNAVAAEPQRNVILVLIDGLR